MYCDPLIHTNWTNIDDAKIQCFRKEDCIAIFDLCGEGKDFKYCGESSTEKYSGCGSILFRRPKGI